MRKPQREFVIEINPDGDVRLWEVPDLASAVTVAHVQYSKALQLGLSPDKGHSIWGVFPEPDYLKGTEQRVLA